MEKETVRNEECPKLARFVVVTLLFSPLYNLLYGLSVDTCGRHVCHESSPDPGDERELFFLLSVTHGFVFGRQIRDGRISFFFQGGFDLLRSIGRIDSGS